MISNALPVGDFYIITFPVEDDRTTHRTANSGAADCKVVSVEITMISASVPVQYNPKPANGEPRSTSKAFSGVSRPLAVVSRQGYRYSGAGLSCDQKGEYRI